MLAIPKYNWSVGPVSREHAQQTVELVRLSRHRVGVASAIRTASFVLKLSLPGVTHIMAIPEDDAFMYRVQCRFRTKELG